MKRIVVICAGRHASVMIEAIQLGRLGEVVCILDDEPAKGGSKILGVPVVGLVKDLSGARERFSFTHGVIGMANFSLRKTQVEIFQRMLNQGIRPLSVVHPSAFVS